MECQIYEQSSSADGSGICLAVIISLAEEVGKWAKGRDRINLPISK